MQVALGEGTLSLRCLLLDCDYLNAQLVRRSDLPSIPDWHYLMCAEMGYHAFASSSQAQAQGTKLQLLDAQGPEAGWEVTAAYVGAARATVPITALYSQVPCSVEHCT